MKSFAVLAASLAAAFSSSADQTTVGELTSHLFTNAAIVWQAPTTNLPKSFWTYKIIRPHIFSQATISNAIILGGLQSRGFPESSTNNTCIADDCACSCAVRCMFSIYPSDASLCYWSPIQTNSTDHISDDQTITKWAWHYAYQLGVDPAKVAEKCLTPHFNTDTNGDSITTQISGRGVYLSRLLDGIEFLSDGNDGFSPEGFWIEFGSYGVIRNFSLIWPDLQRETLNQTASREQIIHCIRAHKTIVMPQEDKYYFEKLKSLATAKKLTITKLTPYYGEGGDPPKNGEPFNFITPFAELEAIADLGTSNATIALFSPITSSDVSRLLEK